MRKVVGAVTRAIDLAGSAVGLALTLPLYAPIALAIRLDSKGPVFFTQRRAGRLAKDGGADGGYHWEDFQIIKTYMMPTVTS